MHHPKIPEEFNPLEYGVKDGVWQYQTAKAKLSQVMDDVLGQGMQFIVRNRKEVYVILTKERFDSYHEPKESLIDFFMRAPYPELDLECERRQDLPREFDL